MAGLSTASNGAAELSDNDGGEESRFELTSILDPAIADPTASPASAAAVRSTESYDSNLYVGTSDGNLLWYTLSNEGSSTQPPTYRLNSTTTISAASKPVEKIVLLQAISVAVVLCESIVTFYELPTFQPIPPSVLPHIKAVATVVQDDAELESGTDTDGLVSLCIIKRKQIILAKLGKERWVHVKEVSLPGGASIARRYREQLCIATTSAYSLVNLADSTILPLGLPISQTTDSPSAQVRPSILSIVPQPASLHSAAGNRRANSSLHRREGTQDGCEFLITSHSENMTLGVFVKSNGEPAPKLIEWPSHPRALVLDRTRVFALLRNDTVEVHDVTTMEKLTTLSVPASLDPRFLAASPSLPSAWLCGKNAVHRVGELPLIRRASRLVGRRDWEGLKELADEAWEHESREEIDVARQRKAVRKLQQAQTRDLQKINQELGFYFLENINFALARRYLSRGRLDPRIVIRLFTDVRRHVLDDDDEDDSRPEGGIQGGMQDEPRAWKTVEDLIRANLEQNYCPPLDAGSDPVLQRLADALLARAKFDLLRGFLVDCRQQRRGEQREGRLGMDELTWRRIGMVIDIVLAKVYAAVGDLDELLAVLNEPGNESLEGEVERALRNSGQYGMLAGLLLKKGDQGGAMETVTELLARQEDPAVREQINLLLDSHSIQLDLPTTIRDLSDEWLLSSSGLQTFLRRRVRQQLHTRQEVQIVRALSLAQNLEVAEKVWGTISQKQKVRREGGGGGGGKGPPVIEDAGKVSVAGEGRDVVEEQKLGKEGKGGGGGRRRGENGRVSIADFGSLSKESPTSVRT
ncbi:hypothetical protein A4X13_0g2824 [Tilletia indica]|uniref:CNH domain-containing protein n=1 Tax=Tilletia indica TaxID=43049 RepID=A0A8T8T4X3_9BASI|nr:hypothetical protein A4X13_0g2824 [Tilletia indica]